MYWQWKVFDASPECQYNDTPYLLNEVITKPIFMNVNMNFKRHFQLSRFKKTLKQKYKYEISKKKNRVKDFWGLFSLRKNFFLPFYIANHILKFNKSSAQTIT